jgi:hypothetical protein
MGVCPGFWDWIWRAHKSGLVFSIREVQDELKATKDALATWAIGHASFFLAPDSRVTNSLAAVSNWTTAQNYKPEAISEFFSVADYWLVGHALAKGFIVVTHEVADPKSRKRVKIPDVCNGVNASWMNPFQMLEVEGARFVL